MHLCIPQTERMNPFPTRRSAHSVSFRAERSGVEESSHLDSALQTFGAKIPPCGYAQDDTGKRIATPVCALVRNDRVGGSALMKKAGNAFALPASMNINYNLALRKGTFLLPCVLKFNFFHRANHADLIGIFFNIDSLIPYIISPVSRT